MIGFATQLLQFAEDRLKDVSGVVGRLLGKVLESVRTLIDRYRALKAHACIHMLGRQVTERAIGFGVVLNKNEVPDLNAEVGIHIDELAIGIAVWRQVNMQFRARTTRASFAHHPEVIFDVAVNNLPLRIESLC